MPQRAGRGGGGGPLSLPRHYLANVQVSRHEDVIKFSAFNGDCDTARAAASASATGYARSQLTRKFDVAPQNEPSPSLSGARPITSNTRSNVDHTSSTVHILNASRMASVFTLPTQHGPHNQTTHGGSVAVRGGHKNEKTPPPPSVTVPSLLLRQRLGDRAGGDAALGRLASFARVGGDADQAALPDHTRRVRTQSDAQTHMTADGRVTLASRATTCRRWQDAARRDTTTTIASQWRRRDTRGSCPLADGGAAGS